MKNLSKKIMGPVQVVILAIIIGATGSYVYAVTGWTEPGCAAPGCNATAPLNVSDDSQVKIGRLTVANGSGITTGLEVVNGNFKVDSGNANANGFFYNSDRSLKQNILPLNDSLSKVLQLQGVSFNWKKSGSADIGLIAQDVEKVYPQIVRTDSTTGIKSVEYGNLVAPLIEAIKAQQKEIDELKAQIKDLQK